MTEKQPVHIYHAWANDHPSTDLGSFTTLECAREVAKRWIRTRIARARWPRISATEEDGSTSSYVGVEDEDGRIGISEWDESSPFVIIYERPLYTTSRQWRAPQWVLWSPFLR